MLIRLRALHGISLMRWKEHLDGLNSSNNQKGNAHYNKPLGEFRDLTLHLKILLSCLVSILGKLAQKMGKLTESLSSTEFLSSLIRGFLDVLDKISVLHKCEMPSKPASYWLPSVAAMRDSNPGSPIANNHLGPSWRNH
jgi:hypothetical protein